MGNGGESEGPSGSISTRKKGVVSSEPVTFGSLKWGHQFSGQVKFYGGSGKPKVSIFLSCEPVGVSRPVVCE